MTRFPPWQLSCLAILRMITGVLAIYHGLEIFDEKIMQGYLGWEVFKSLPATVLVVYFGKAMELVAGLSLLVGLFTRVGAGILTIVMLFITFYVSHGKFWYEDQHPFLFAMLGIVYLVLGPVKWSLDQQLKLFGSTL